LTGPPGLTITAEAEHAITQVSRHRPGTVRPLTARPSTGNTATTEESSATSSIAQYIPQLLEAIKKDGEHAEDEFQAQVCLGWVHWQLGETDLAVAKLPRSIEEEFAQLDGTNNESSEWTKVCALKASYIKGNSQSSTGAVAQALDTFESALSILSSIPTNPKQGKELRIWAELFLTSFCILSSHAIKSKMTPILETETISAFRAWAKFWESQAPTPTGGRAAQADIPRRQVWKQYYITLSDILQQELPFPTTSLTTAYAQTSTRLQQRAELKRVEARYETLLLSEVEFPKAEEASAEVEAFVEVSMLNWRVLCGPNWHERDLGEGGSEAVSKGVLDILYRAATKTFHSTAILRHLFTVHLAVAEFDLAFKAFDTYMDIVKKGKARVEKTGEAEHGLDDDEMVLKTASECINALCKFGSLQGAEKAKDLGQFFEEWLDKHHPIETQNGNSQRPANGSSPETSVVMIAPHIFAMTWRCIGIGHAQWARLTYDAASRSEIQLRAIKCFRKSLLPQFESTTNVETLFALGVILAERRELPAALEIVKLGLLPRPPTKSDVMQGPRHGRFGRERSLIPLWHLLALLLSARQEFLTAARACEGAFEQFQDPRNLFGEGDITGNFRSAHLNEKSSSKTEGVVDDMDDFEKEAVLEVKMTQLSLIEVLEGPDIAVNASDELLSLYARLFGDPQKTFSDLSSGNALAVPPQSSAGTIRSITGSIFGRSGRSVRKSNNNSGSLDTPLAIRPQTTQTLAPTIQVTSENGNATRRAPSTKGPGEHHHEKLQKRSASISRKKNGGARNRSTSTGRMQSSSIGNSTTIAEREKSSTPSTDAQLREEWFSSGPPTTQLNPLLPVSQQKAHKEALCKVAQLNPVTRFPKDQERRRRTAILIKVWLLISGFYRRASMNEDARGAIEEAQKLVHNIEIDASKDGNGNFSIDHAGWAGGKSIGELWGDIFSEVRCMLFYGLTYAYQLQRGHLAVAIETPYIALAHFESALTHFADHPTAMIGLSDILLDIYTEDLLPPPSIPKMVIPSPLSNPSASTTTSASIATISPLVDQPAPIQPSSSTSFIPPSPLGLPPMKSACAADAKATPNIVSTPDSVSSGLQPSYKESSTALLDRLAARDRAYGLLTTLTKLGTGWNCSEAWFVLARAYEEGGQPDKAREVLWWCVELEEGRGVRDWSVIGAGGYVL
jgi:tetratricopeptide (TPR) repeat protein